MDRQLKLIFAYAKRRGRAGGGFVMLHCHKREEPCALFHETLLPSPKVGTQQHVNLGMGVYHRINLMLNHSEASAKSFRFVQRTVRWHVGIVSLVRLLLVNMQDSNEVPAPVRASTKNKFRRLSG